MTNPVPIRHRDPLATRRALLEAGEELFAARGYDGVSVEQIARRAGVNKALVNYHFGGKSGLYGAVLAAMFTTVAERLRGLGASTLPADALLREYLRAFGALHTTHPTLSVLILREIVAGQGSVDDRILPHLIGFVDLVREIVARGVAEGCFRPVDPVMTHLTIVGSIALFFASAGFRARVASARGLPEVAPPSSEYVRHVEEFILRGLAADRAPRT